MAEGKIIKIHDFEDRVKRKIRRHLKSLGYVIDNNKLIPPQLTKESIRLLHSKQRQEKIDSKKSFFKRLKPQIYNYFANGSEIVPNKIKPKLELVKPSTVESDLFNLATMVWSIPVSESGPCRSMRFLVWDEYNNKLMGILAIKDPAIGLKARDDFIGWDRETKFEKLINVMDSYIVGAIPPYNQLLCGKLVACLLKSIEIKDLFNFRYKNSVGLISKKRKNPKLVLITTSSALGRSSIYNRLNIGQRKFMTPVAYTEGWGHFHFSKDILKDFDQLLKRKKHKYYKGYKMGDGSNFKFRKIRVSLDYLNLSKSLLRHTIKREFFFTPLATNYLDILNKRAKRPDYSLLQSVDEVSEMALDRWVLQRASTDSSYKKWKNTQIKEIIFDQKNYQKLPSFKNI